MTLSPSARPSADNATTSTAARHSDTIAEPSPNAALAWAKDIPTFAPLEDETTQPSPPLANEQFAPMDEDDEDLPDLATLSGRRQREESNEVEAVKDAEMPLLATNNSSQGVPDNHGTQIPDADAAAPPSSETGGRAKRLRGPDDTQEAEPTGRKRRTKKPKLDDIITWCFCGEEEPDIGSWDELDQMMIGRSDVIACSADGCETRWVRLELDICFHHD